MATHKSAEKRIRQTERRTAVNRARVSRLRTFMKKVETAIESGDKEAARRVVDYLGGQGSFDALPPRMREYIVGATPTHVLAAH